MRIRFIASLFLLAVMFGCTKNTDESASYPSEDKGCINRVSVAVTDHSGHSINAANIPIINQLFAANGINQSTYRYHYYFSDSVQTFFPPFTKYKSEIVRVTEFVNGLELFNGELVFSFKNGVFNFKNGSPTGGTALSTVPSLTPGQIRTLFLGHIEQFEQKKAQYKDSCFRTEFGYYNLNAGSANPAEELVKCWKVSANYREYPSGYPMAYYRDKDAKLIYYDNGIQTFR